MAHMFYRVRLTIIDGERGLMEMLRKFYPLYLARERWFGDLIQRFARSVISQASTRRGLVPTFVMVLFIIGEILAWWSSWPLPITSILFIIRGDIKTGRSWFRCAWRNFIFKLSISSCMASVLFCLWETWLPIWEWLLLICVVCTLPSRSYS